MDLLKLLSHLAFAAAIFACSTALTYVMARFVRVMDVPNDRSSHARPVPKSGGIAFVATFLIGSLIIYFVADIARIDDRYFWGYVVTAVLLAIVSFVDDITQKTFLVKVLTQMVCVAVVLTSGVVLTRLAIPYWGEVELGWVGYVLTFLWILGLTNAYNFMDGLDGLAAGVAVIAAAFLCAIAFQQKSVFVYISSYVLLAGAAGFLLFNFPPAKIFMGDIGSAFLGFTFATLAVIGSSLDLGRLSFYIVPMLLFHFIFDTFFTFARRLMRGEQVHLAHRTHLYQLLNRSGYSHRAVALFHYAVTVGQGVVAYVSIDLPADRRLFVFIPFLVFEIIYARWVLRRAARKGLL
ncbi:MAG TPA: glycosyltransferase family 4 protein [Burkholderiales bacterium]|nr:glycosyltransferase family 4 protein [Burkholderiales bacterium]